MMFLLGKGGEGKSRIGLVLKNLMGDAVSNGSIQKVETSRFARADLENRLLTVTQFKVQREQERLDNLTSQIDQKEQSLAQTNAVLSKKERELAAVQKKSTLTKNALIHAQDVANLGKKTLLGNYSLTEEEFSQLKSQAAHGFMVDVENRQLKQQLSAAQQDSIKWQTRYKYKDHSGKPCEGWESFKTKKEAQERKITVEKELLDGTFLVPDTMTVEEMLYKWIPIQSTKHKWAPKTYTQSVAMVQNLIVPYIGSRRVQELRTYDVEKFYATLAKTPCGQYVQGVKQELSEKQKKRLLSSTSIHEVHTLLKTAFSYAVEWDLIHKIPLPRDAPKVNAEERTIWDEKTMLAALQTIENPALHLAVHMSMILSLRESEILGLQPSDLDFDAADGRGTIAVNKIMQRANKDALEQLDPNQVYHTFPDRREGSKSSLILKKPKTKKSNRVLYMTKPLKEELQAWLEKISQDEQNAPEKYRNCGQLFRLPDGLPIAPELLTKWYRLWRAEHPEFEQIVFHGLRHSSATYQLLQSDGDFKSVQGNTGHATAAVLMDTYAHTQDKPRLELTEKIEANFYSQDLTPAAPQPQQNEKPVATKITGKEILEAIRLMDADERRELTRALFA